ncbi:MAG: amidohydrolase family protein, partial [Thermodesulfobacteriota bacterium]|nr:amidohydrolase family protein [Thermodesulfobacteriota bacterium]
FEKEVPFAEALCGISGLDTALALCMKLVKDKVLSLSDLIRTWSSGPCAIYGLKNNEFKPGDPADFLLFDQKAPWEVGPDTLHSKGKNTPLTGTTLPGRVRALFLKGKRIV